KAIHRANRMLFTIKSDLLGNYQQHNIRTVLAAIEILSLTTSFQLPIERAIEALAHVKQLTGLRGRWDVLQTHPLIVTDVAHNAAGVQEVFSQWNAINATTKHIVVGFVKDKDVTKALTHFPKEAVYYFCQANIPRALPSHELFQLASTLGFNGVAFSSVATAVAAAQSAMKHDDALLITGSFFIVNEAMEVIA
ncbi:MAG TPA: bifunctional folylpolyglutamate synthase/dihydrofolate synthase, partial [Flavipsychrobacter sp.]|nr:bifunctional folylpolyglutamate synthase/dihydrofolate synthase [Flavipsychrobacter sp.]